MEQPTASPRPRGAVTFGALVRGSILYTIGSVVPRIGVFLLLPIYTRGMGPAEFGVFSLMISLAGLLTILYRLGIDGALLRFHFDRESSRAATLYWTMATVTLVAGSVLSVVLLAFAGPAFSTVFVGIDVVPYGLLATGIAFVTAFQYVPTTWFRATERPGRVVVFGLATFVVGASATLVLVVGLHLGAVGGLLGQLAAGMVVVAVTLAVLSRRRPARVDAELAREGLRFGLPLVPHGLAGWALNLSDRWVIGLTIGLGVVATQRAIGIYSLGYQLGQVVAVVALSLNTAWVPFFYAHGREARGPELLREMTTLSVGALAVLATFTAALAPDAISVLAPRSWQPDAGVAVGVTQLVSLAYLVQGIYFMAVSPVFLERRTAILPVITLAAGACNITLNALLIPRLGIIAAAWSTVVGYGVLTVGTVLYARRGYRLLADWPRLAAVIALAASAAPLTAFLGPRPLLEAIAVHGGVGILLSLVIAIILRRPVGRARHLVHEIDASARHAGDAA